MRILQILPELNVGGVETGTLDLSRHLIKLGHVSIVVSNGGALVPQLIADGARHYQLPVHRKSLIAMVRMISKLADIIRKEKIDIVHARSRVPAWIAYFACRRTKAVFITTCHGYYSKHPFSFVMGWAKRVIVISNVIARHMIEDYDVPYERIRLVPRSVDMERFHFTRPDTKRTAVFHVGIIGRITPLKGHLHFIKAMAKVSKEIPGLKVWIVGDAPASKAAYKEELRTLVHRLGLSDSTEFLGTQKDIPGIMQQLDALVLATTTHEAFGRVIVEAQACGVPVVATKVGGVIDVVDDGRTGYLVSPADPDGMAEAVVKIYKDKDRARVMAEAAFEKVKEKYTVERMVANTIAVYEDALRSSKILVIKFSSLGDIILSTAAIRAIREKFPGHTISFLVGESSKELLLRCPHIDELLVADFKNKDRGLRSLWRLGSLLRKKNFDVVIDLQNNRKSHILAALSLCLNRYGYDNKKFGFLLNNRIKDDRALIAPVEHQFRILKLLGITLAVARLELWPSEQDSAAIDELLTSQWLASGQKLIGIHVSASVRWQTKNWPLVNMAKLCDKLAALDMRVVVTGSVEDAGRVQELMNLSPKAKIINAVGKTSINQLYCLVRHCSVFISADSSPLHVAAAAGVPYVALFGPTDERRHLPPAKRFEVIAKALSCRPCYKPRCKDAKCMRSISADEVLGAVERLLG